MRAVMNTKVVISVAAALLAGPTSLLFLLGFVILIITNIGFVFNFNVIYMFVASYALYSLWHLVFWALKNKSIADIKPWIWVGLVIGCCIASNMIITGVNTVADYRGDIANRETLLYLWIIALNPIILTTGLIVFLYKKDSRISKEETL